jgi:hypothetical protein
MPAIRRAGILFALVVLVGILAACTATDPRLEDEFDFESSPSIATRHDSAMILSGADATLAADESVDLLIIYNGTAQIQGDASVIWVLNGTANLVGGNAGSVVAIQSEVTLDSASTVSGDIRTFESEVTGTTATTVVGGIRDFGLDMLVMGWREWMPALFLIYVAFAVSAVMAGLVLAGLAGRQVRAAGALITKEPVMVVVAGVVGLMAIMTAGILATISVVGIPFALGLFALVLPGLFLVGYLVSGIWLGERILTQSPISPERPYRAALVGLTIVGVVSLIPMVGGLIAFVGFGAVMVLSWRVVRGEPGAVPYTSSVGRVAEVPG